MNKEASFIERGCTYTVLFQKRWASSAWRAGDDQNFVILGGGASDAAALTSEIVSSDSTRPSFNLKYKTM